MGNDPDGDRPRPVPAACRKHDHESLGLSSSFPTESIQAIIHDLAQPLSAILNLASAIGRRLEADGDKDLATIASWNRSVAHSAQHMMQLLDRLRETCQPPRLRIARHPLKVVIEESAALLQFECQQNSIRFQLQMDDDLESLDLDRTQIQQVIVNLLRNAFDAVLARNPAERQVVLWAHVRGNTVALGVEDNGPGISVELADRVFQPFFTTKEHGSGLGLAICKNIIEAHGGQIWVARDRTEGCQICFTIPRRRED